MHGIVGSHYIYAGVNNKREHQGWRGKQSIQFGEKRDTDKKLVT